MRDETALKMLIARLNWPVRMVKLCTVREYGALLSSPSHSALATRVYLEWLSSRFLESEIISGLCVLFCTNAERRPPFQVISDHIFKPSLLTNWILRKIYGEDLPGWERAHSGEVPLTYSPEPYFLKYKTSHVPPILETHFNSLETKQRLPFMRQWAYEWAKITEASKSPLSGFPYYFVDSSLSRRGISGQFCQRQSDVYRSAFLRTLACAVDCWSMPANLAEFFALDVLPINMGLLELSPVDRPVWLGTLPDDCTKNFQDVDQITKKIIQLGEKNTGMLPVSLKIPLPRETDEFGELTISALLATDDFVPDFDLLSADNDRPFSGFSQWILEDDLSFMGPLGQKEIQDSLSAGRIGSAVPISLDLMPRPLGFWHGDYFHCGISMPAPYLFEKEATILTCNDHIETLLDNKLAASWCVWHDNWSSLYAKEGNSRCGMLTTVGTDIIEAAQRRLNLKIGWLVEAKQWKSKTDYGEYIPSIKRAFFFN